MAEIISAATLLFLVMDPLGNIPIFLSVLEDVAPERRKDLAKVGLKAMIGGALASWTTATIAGILIG